MGRYFKIIDKSHNNRRYVVKAPVGSQLLFCEIEELVGMLPCPENGIPHALEVDGWGEMACEGDIYEADEFDVECITEEEYDEWQIPNY